MDFTAWLTSWLARHPLQAPDALDRARYTAQVMQKLTDEMPRPFPAARWFSWPSVAMVFATTAAGVLIVLAVGHRADRQLAQLTPASPPAHETRALMLAESVPTSDETWVQDTAQLLEQLDEDASHDDANATSDEEWLKDLQALDDGDLGANS